MDKLIYKRGTKDTREFQKIEFDIHEDLNITEFKLVCIRLAKALGYSENNIVEIFGNVDASMENIFGE
jgi:hypothetical protein